MLGGSIFEIEKNMSSTRIGGQMFHGTGYSLELSPGKPKAAGSNLASKISFSFIQLNNSILNVGNM